MLRKIGMSPAQCATGLRVTKLIAKIGLDEDSIEAFLSQVYTKLQEAGVKPKHIARYAEGLASLLEGRSNDTQQTALSLPEIERFFEKMKQDTATIKEEFKMWETKVQEIRREASLSDRSLEESLREKKRIEMDLGWKSELSDEMRKHGLTIDDLLKLVGASPFFKEHGFNVEEMFLTFSRYKEREDAIASQERLLAGLKERSLEVEQENKFQEELLDGRRLANSELDSLKKMGFGPKEFKTLRNLLTEIAAAKGLSVEDNDPVNRFLSDIENHYPDYLNLRGRVNELKNVEQFQLAHTSTLPQLKNAVSSFLRRGATRADILKIINILEGYPNSLQIPSSPSNTSDITPESTANRENIEHPPGVSLKSIPTNLAAKGPNTTRAVGEFKKVGLPRYYGAKPTHPMFEEDNA
jgi:hypothetical protein